jgi:hypothetical protein
VTGSAITLDTTVNVAREVVFKELRGESVLLDLSSGMYFGLDETSTRLWQMLSAHGSLRRTFDEMLSEFDVEADQLERDLVAFVGSLVRCKLVRVNEPTASR